MLRVRYKRIASAQTEFHNPDRKRLGFFIRQIKPRMRPTFGVSSFP
nr:MAG TPA: hypothetical protein [Caudoviricetes sp.]